MQLGVVVSIINFTQWGSGKGHSAAPAANPFWHTSSSENASGDNLCDHYAFLTALTCVYSSTNTFTTALFCVERHTKKPCVGRLGLWGASRCWIRQCT